MREKIERMEEVHKTLEIELEKLRKREERKFREEKNNNKNSSMSKEENASKEIKRIRKETTNIKEKKKSSQEGDKEDRQIQNGKGSKEEEGRKQDRDKKNETWNQDTESKEKICLEYVKTGKCKYQENCKFRHKKVCNKFLEQGKCQVEKCQQIHNRSVLCHWAEKCSKKECKFIHTTYKGDTKRCKWEALGEGKCRYREKCKFGHEQGKKEEETKTKLNKDCREYNREEKKVRTEEGKSIHIEDLMQMINNKLEEKMQGLVDKVISKIQQNFLMEESDK